MKSIRTNAKNPELYIGVPMERQEAVYRENPVLAHLGFAAHLLRENEHDGAKVPAFIFASNPTDSNYLVFYRRTFGYWNGRGDGRQAAWKNTALHWTKAIESKQDS